MTFSQPPPRPAGPRPQLSRFAWLLPALASPLLALQAPSFVLRPAQASARPSLPYLVAADPGSIRFAPPRPDLSTTEALPAAAAPPVPGGVHEEVAAINRDAQVSTEPAPAPEPDPDMLPLPALTEPPPAAAAATPSRPQTPVALLRDELHREVRPEDVLPLFEPPGSSFLIAVPPPASAPSGPTQPPSSATYRRQ